MQRAATTGGVSRCGCVGLIIGASRAVEEPEPGEEVDCASL